jgi:hypothetical protein
MTKDSFCSRRTLNKPTCRFNASGFGLACVGRPSRLLRGRRCNEINCNLCVHCRPAEEQYGCYGLHCEMGAAPAQVYIYIYIYIYIKLLYISEIATTFSVAHSNSTIDINAVVKGINDSFEGNAHSFNEINQSRNSPTEFCIQIFGLSLCSSVYFLPIV